MTEKDIQNYIWENRSSFNNFLKSTQFPEMEEKEPWNYSHEEILYNRIIDKYKTIWESLKNIDIFACEVPLKKNGDSTIRTDFLGSLSGQNGLVIIELKKSRQTERQAYTELLAYGNHMRSLFLTMSKADIVYLLISPMEERIVRDATIQTLLFDKNNVCALVPEFDNNDISTLKLSLWIPSLEDVTNISQGCFIESNFDVLKISWEALPGVWFPEKEGDSPDEYMMKKLNWVSSFASQIMEEQGIHGFTYCSQAFSDKLSKTLPLTNSLVIVAINPYKATKSNNILSNDDATINISNIINGLKNNNFDYNKENILEQLSCSWTNVIESIGYKVVKELTKSMDRDNLEMDSNNFSWDSYQQNYLEDIHCYNFDITLTGLLRDLFLYYTALDMDYVKRNGYKDNLMYDEGDIPNNLIDMLHSQSIIRDFIKRLHEPFHRLRDYI